MTDLTDALTLFEQSTYWAATSGLGKGYGVGWPLESRALAAWVAQLDIDPATPPPAALVSKHARGLAGMLHAVAVRAATPSVWAVAAPGSVGVAAETITGALLPVHLYAAPATVTDKIVVGSSNSAVMVEHGAAGSILRRLRCDPCCDLPWTSAWGRHGAYLKALNVSLFDFYARTPGGYEVSNGISSRMAGLVVTRAELHGFPLAIGHFQELNPDGTKTSGTLTFLDVRGDFTSDCGVWIDVNSASTVDQHFAFEAVDLTGPTDFFGKANAATFGTSTIEMRNCTINGKPATAASWAGVPAGRVTVL